MQTNCVYRDERYWCFADVVPYASPLFPNSYNTSTHLFSANARDMAFRYEHEVGRHRGPQPAHQAIACPAFSRCTSRRRTPPHTLACRSSSAALTTLARCKPQQGDGKGGG